MSARDESLAFFARVQIREVAMSLARSGMSDDVIRECMRDLAETEAERAIQWGRAEDERQELADRIDDIGDELEANREREAVLEEGHS